jgi:hypothetical protein
MLDVEDRIGRVWNPDVRPLVREAYGSYNTGASRASIILTWGAVCADLIEKFRRLSDDGEGVAVAIVTKIEKAREQNNVKLMQNVEASLLEEAERMQLVDGVERRELERLREDRHLCAHPSLRPLGDFYSPSPEYARAHLTAALDSLLVHPPSQGRRVIDLFHEHVAAPDYVGSAEYIRHAFYDRVKPTARRRIVDLAAKIAVLELEATESMQLANRMANCLRLFADRDRVLVHEVMLKVVDRLGEQSRSTQVRAVARLGDQEVFWSAVSPALFEQLSGLVDGSVRETVVPTSDELDLLSLAAVEETRERLPGLKPILEKLPQKHLAEVIGRRPGPYFTKYLAQLLEGAPAWRTAEAVTRTAVLPCAPYLTVEHLDTVMQAWASNDQCRTAIGMVDSAVELYEATDHLRPNDEHVWRGFIESVRAHDIDPNSAFRYHALAQKTGMS